MKKFIELKYEKNHKFEIEFENLDEIEEDDNVILRLKDGDVSPLFYLNPLNLPYNIKLFIPNLRNSQIIDRVVLHLTDDGYDENILYTFDADTDINNILPKWNIPNDNAILFLSERDKERYKYLYRAKNSYLRYYSGGDRYSINKVTLGDKRISEMTEQDTERFQNKSKDKTLPDKISIIIPELHKDNIQEINNIAKELKEKYGIKEVNLFVSHCFIEEIHYTVWKTSDHTDRGLLQEKCWPRDDMRHILVDILHLDKITTTNSTGILEPQKNERLEVIDVKEFFESL